MSTTTDKLAVALREARVAAMYQDSGGIELPELGEAWMITAELALREYDATPKADSAAIAELIEADLELDAADQAHSEVIETEGYRCEDETVAFNRLTEAKQRRRAALARVGGAK